MSGIKTDAWGDDRITFNTCTGYNKLYEDTLIESKSPLKKTVLKFFEEANYCERPTGFALHKRGVG